MVAINHDKRPSIDELREMFTVDGGTVLWRTSGMGRHVGKPAGTVLASGYRKIGFREDGKFIQLYAHHIVWALAHGAWPDRPIDHINGQKDDSRIENLRLATYGENSANRRRAVTNACGRKWVCLHKDSVRRGKPNVWQAAVWAGPKKKQRYFGTRDEAYAWACTAAKQLHGDFYNPGQSA